MFSSYFYKCLLKFTVIIILLECTIHTQAVEDWNEDDHFNTGRKLMEKSMNGGEFAIYIIVVVIFSMISICCRLYCRHACKDECECSNDDSNDNCDGCCYCCDDHLDLTHPSHVRATTTNTWQPPVQQQPQVQQQPRQFTNFGTLSPEPNTLSFYNRTHFTEQQNIATVFAQDSSNIQASGIANAPPAYNFTNAPSVPPPYNAPSESHIYNIPNIPAPVNSVNADYADPPPDYTSVLLGDLLRGIENTQLPRVTQDK